MRFSGADIEFRLSTVRRPEISSAGHQLPEGKLAEFQRGIPEIFIGPIEVEMKISPLLRRGR